MSHRRRSPGAVLRSTVLEIVLLLVLVWLAFNVLMPAAMNSAKDVHLQFGPTAIPSVSS